MRKNIFKKSIGMIMAAGLMMTSLAGCGTTSEAPAETAKPDSNYTDPVAEYEYGDDTCKQESTAASAEYTESQSDMSAVESYNSLSSDMSNEKVYNGCIVPGYDDTTKRSDSRQYNHVSENDFIATKSENVSTFSADVDTASYSNIRGYINSNAMVPEDAVRIEEMINYFHYDYKEPEAGEPFSVNMEVDGCPWNPNHQLVMIGLKSKAIKNTDRKPTNFVFLIDTSGSMDEPDKLPLVKCAYVKLLSELNENDTVSIVTYAGSDEVVLKGENGANTDKIANAIENLDASGCTNGSAGINTAYKIAEKYFKKNGNNHVILATDGDLNVGVTSEDGLIELIKEKKESGIFLSVLGFGNDNLKDNKLEALADNGNGNYSFIDSVYEAKRVLVEEMGSTLETVAKDVKLQATFDNEVVEKYRLIGYENRMLAKEDFDDDTVDGGEIGSGHEVTALYEIVPTKDADIYTGSGKNHILDLSIRYKEPKEDDSKLLKYTCNYSIDGFENEASDNMLWAESVACFGMLLKRSDYAGMCSISMAQKLALQTSYADDALRVEYLSLLNNASRLYDGSYYYNEIEDYDDYESYEYSSDDESDVTVIDAN
ncbi:MAG: VWA domain-containing protein [Eubacterium sp.]|nr:VWA domain-containing protein [Eubacterium sp.]